MKQFPKRGEIYWVDLDPTVGSEINKKRPAIIISNDVGNELSKRVIVAPITSKATKVYPFEVEIELNGIKGKILIDQLRSIDKQRLSSFIDTASNKTLLAINEALKKTLAIS